MAGSICCCKKGGVLLQFDAFFLLNKSATMVMSCILSYADTVSK
jgi:hypothetical protein